MKPKVVPTSPTGRNNAAALEQLYEKKNDQLIRPQRVRLGWAFGTTLIIVAFVTGLLGTVVFDWLVYQTPHWGLWQRLNVTVPTTPTVISTPNDNSSETWNAALLKAQSSVVTLYRTRSGEAVWDRLYQPADAIGTAIIVSTDGLLVGLDATSISVEPATVAITTNGTALPIRTTFDDPVSPFTFFTVEGESLNAAAFVTLEQLSITQQVGQFQSNANSFVVNQIAAIATPRANVQSSEGLNRTLTVAQPPRAASVIVTARGDIVGLTTADGTIAPLYQIMSVLADALREGAIERPYFGVHGIAVSTSGLSAEERDGQTQGMLLLTSSDGAAVGVIEESPAAKAGLRVGDIIISIDDQTITSPDDVAEYIQSQGLGETISVQYVRDGVKNTTNATLAKVSG